MKANKYIIWSLEHKAWWMANHCGYTEDITKAGEYSSKEADEIITEANKYVPKGKFLEEITFQVPYHGYIHYGQYSD